MGYNISYIADDFIMEIRRNPVAVFGEDYPLYIIALATEMDKEAIKWLIEYRRAVDSLTHRSAAFITFYNSVRFQVRKEFTSTSIRSTVKGGRISLKDSASAINIEVSPWALSSPQVLKYELDHKMGNLDMEAFVSAMTYESDSMARCLGINFSDLPCFVFIDDPNSKEYYSLPISDVGSDLFDILRIIMGEFRSHKKNKPYFDLINQIEALQSEYNSIKAKSYPFHRHVHLLTDEKNGISKPFGHNLSVKALLEFDDYSKAKSVLEKWLICIYGNEIPNYINSIIVNKFDPDFFYRAKKPWKSRRRIERAVEHFSRRLSSGRLNEMDGMGLFDLYSRFRIYLKDVRLITQEEIYEVSIDEWSEMLKAALAAIIPIEKEQASEIELLQNAIGGIKVENVLEKRLIAINENIKHNHQEIAKIEADIPDIENAIDDLKLELKKVNQPKIEPILDKIKWIQRREIISSFITRTSQTAGRGAETIIKAVELGMRASGKP
jgi:hypothetical protein